MKLDEQLQRELLEMACEASPLTCDVTEDLLNRYEAMEIAGTLLYLKRHGLIETGTQVGIDGFVSFGYFEATEKGLDFIDPAGGIGAILGVVTVRFHEDTIKQLVIDRIEQSSEAPTAKSVLIKQVKALPAEGLKTLTTTALRAALTDLPNAMHQLHTWLGVL